MFMRILSVTYPKKEEDIRKLYLLVNNYNENKRALVESEMKETQISDLDLMKKQKSMAPFGV